MPIQALWGCSKIWTSSNFGDFCPIFYYDCDLHEHWDVSKCGLRNTHKKDFSPIVSCILNMPPDHLISFCFFYLSSIHHPRSEIWGVGSRRKKKWCEREREGLLDRLVTPSWRGRVAIWYWKSIDIMSKDFSSVFLPNFWDTIATIQENNATPVRTDYNLRISGPPKEWYFSQHAYEQDRVLITFQNNQEVEKHISLCVFILKIIVHIWQPWPWWFHTTGVSFEQWEAAHLSSLDLRYDRKK